MTEKIKVGVVGVGRMGTYHLRKYLEISGAQVVGIFDPNPTRSELVASEYNVRAYETLPELLFEADAISIASPTVTHYSIARQAIEAGVDVLVEKPLCGDIDHAQALVEFAKKKGTLLQVGFVERFRLSHLLGGMAPEDIRYIETHRLSPSLNRETEIDVISDLMIHDLDLVLSLFGESPTTVSAIAVPVITPYYDLANVRLEFPNGAVATLNASRVSPNQERKIRVFSEHSYVSVDFLQNDVSIHRKTREGTIDRSTVKHPELDALRMQCEAFLGHVRNRQSPLVPGEAGLQALRVLSQIHESARGRIRSPRPKEKEVFREA